MRAFVIKLIIVSRYAMVPFLLGLTLALLLLLISFLRQLWDFVVRLPTASDTDVLITILALIDLTLVGSLTVVVVFSGYENFVGTINSKDASSWPNWMSTITFDGLKQKLFASMMAISGVALLKALMKLDESVSEVQLRWLVIANVVFVASYAILALTDRFSQPHSEKATEE